MSKKESVTPLHNRVIVKPMDVDKVTKSGIIIPETAREKPTKGTVLALGKGIEGEPMTVKKGDNVLYAKNAGLEIEMDGQACRIMKETDIIAII